MKISIVIPIYNEEKYIGACLQSLLHQDCPVRCEIIVVDNGSSDTGPVLANAFGVKVVPCSRRGVVNARECGFQASTGKIILQADADTVYPVSWVSQVVSRFDNDKDVVGVQGEVEYTASPLWIRPFHVLRRFVNFFGSSFLGKPLLCLAGNFAFKKDALQKIGGYRTDILFFGDGQDLLARLSKLGKIAYDPTIAVRTSSRRFRIGFLKFFFLEWMYQIVIGSLFARIVQRSLPFFPSSPRGESQSTSPHRFRSAFSTGIGLVAVIGGILAWGYFYPESQIFGKIFAEAHPQEQVVALTFDDGPNEPYTSEILDILKFYNVKATFFVVGKNVEYYPDIVKRILAEGHVLGNHSYTHKAFSEFDIPNYSELDRAQSEIFKVGGVKPHLFRPPFGRKTPWELEYIEQRGLVIVTWSVFGQDTGNVSSERITNFTVAHAKPGSIILLHDGNELVHGGDRSKTVVALPGIIESLQEKRFKFVTVPELFHISPYLK